MDVYDQPSAALDDRPTELTVERPATVPADLVGLLAALVTVVLWASAFVGIRAAAADLSPGGLAFGRLLVASVALGLVVLVRRPLMPRGRDLGLVVATGILWLGIYNLALNSAETLVDAGTAALLVSVAPLLIVIFAGAFLREGFPPRLVTGSVIAFAGAAVIGLATTGAERARRPSGGSCCAWSRPGCTRPVPPSRNPCSPGSRV